MHKYTAAFTLVEMLLVLSIVGLLFACFEMNFNGFMQRTQSSINQEKIVTAINQAQMLATLNDETIRLCFADGRYACYAKKSKYLLLFHYKNNARQLIAKIKLAQTLGKYHWRLFPKSKTDFAFQSTRVTNGTIWYCDQQAKPQFAIVINKIGTTKVTKPDAHGAIQDSQGKVLSCR